jgi:hypothetical protein
MREAGVTSTVCRCARPTGGRHARTTRGPAQRSRGVKRRPRCVSTEVGNNATNNTSIIKAGTP